MSVTEAVEHIRELEVKIARLESQVVDLTCKGQALANALIDRSYYIHLPLSAEQALKEWNND